MLRVVLPSLALVLFTTAAFGDDYRDPDNLFRFTMPEGWATAPVPLPALKLTVVSPRLSETGGNCNVAIAETPAIKSMTQAEVDAKLSAEINAAFWTAQLNATGAYKQSNIEKSGKRTQHDRNVYFVRVTSEADIGGQTINVTQLQDIHAGPGRVFFVTCTALVDGIAREESDFTTITTSFEPGSEPPVAMLPDAAPPSLTLYALAKFSGVSRLVTRDTPDLTPFGWSRAAASLSVAGDSAWQVCDGANYTGRCRTVAGSTPSLPNLGFTAVSARRLTLSPSGVLHHVTASGASDALAASLKSLKTH